MQVIREREPRDLPALFEVFCQPSCRAAMSGPDFPSREALGAWLDAAAVQGVNLVALDGETAVAFGGLYRGVAERSHVGWLSLFVHDAHQRRGFGTALMRRLIEIAESQWRAHRLELVVVCDNAAAIAFYQCLGFGVEGRHVGFARRDDMYIDVYTMARLGSFVGEA